MRIPAMAVTVLATALLASLPGAAVGAGHSGTGGAAFAPGEGGRHTLLGQRMRFAGQAPAGATVAVQRLDDGLWVTEATAVADARGAYVATWRTDTIGVFRMRAVPTGGGTVRASATEDTVKVTIYKPAKATWYGPGFYGRRTACGQRMSRTLVGVAHKTLPCGRKVAILYKGRTLTVPVVDRGPYANGASWDLTYAAAQMLGFEYTDMLGAVSLVRR